MKKKVSIIIIHYNQSEYVKTALNSVFNQTYKDIELIFADDASSDINLTDLKDFCKKNNYNKIKIIWQINKENLGTVKNLNAALSKCSGDYVLIFAADDKLYSNDVIEKYVNSFEKQEKDVALIFGQCYMMDQNLEKINYKFIDYNRGSEFNKLSSLDQFKILSSECFIAMGASMLRMDILKKLNKFDENYKYIEDYSIFLNIALNNYRMIFDPEIIGLYHRDGGISHRDESKKIEQHHIDFFEDIIKITENYIFPHFDVFNFEEKNKIVDMYVQRIRDLATYNILHDISAFKKLKKNNFLFFVVRKINNLDKDFNVYVQKKIKLLLNMVYLITCLLYMYDKFYHKIYLKYLILLFLYIFFLNLIVFCLKNLYHFFKKIIH